MIDNTHLYPMRTVMLGKRQVIAAGPITKQAETCPYRYILADRGSRGYVVCTERLRVVWNVDGDYMVFSDGYGHGTYFSSPGDLGDALRKFCDSLHEDSGCVESILSDQGIAWPPVDRIVRLGGGSGLVSQAVPSQVGQEDVGPESVLTSVPSPDDTQDFPGI